MKFAITVFVLLSISNAFANDDQEKGRNHHRGGLQLTDAQRACLAGIIGNPDEGERPTREAHQQALADCGIESSESGSNSNAGSVSASAVK